MRFSILIFLLLTVSAVQAQQSTSRTSTNDLSWFNINPSYKLNDHWTVLSEFHVRRTNFVSDPFQYLVRPSVHYKHSSNLKYALGYTYIQNYPFGEFMTGERFPEHNVWEQVQFDANYGKLHVSNRLRMEHRFMGQVVAVGNEHVVEDYTFQNRMRFQLELLRDILSFDDKTWFLAVADELFVVFNDNLSIRNLNQNRFILTTGLKTPHWTGRIGYMNLYFPRPDNVGEKNRTLVLSLAVPLN